MLEKRLEGLWRDLQGKKPHLPHFLSEIRLDGIRGLNNLRVVFDYPVSVIAGGNTTGKSTVLFAAACAYSSAPDRTERRVRSLSPSSRVAVNPHGFTALTKPCVRLSPHTAFPFGVAFSRVAVNPHGFTALTKPCVRLSPHTAFPFGVAFKDALG